MEYDLRVKFTLNNLPFQYASNVQLKSHNRNETATIICTSSNISHTRRITWKI